ncbi:MAG: hypothetical protein P8124_06190 [Gammaproteobacteria bacterium]|jgi:hypothetical protein
MIDSRSAVRAETDACEEFRQGMEHFRRQDWRDAVGWFRQAEARADRRDMRRNRYTAYHGLALVLMGDLSGLNLCRRAASDERQDAEVFACQARAEVQLNHRRRAWQAVSRGLELEPGHADLRRLRALMGVRRPPLLPFLSRDHLLNRILGRLSYRGGGRNAKPPRVP